MAYFLGIDGGGTSIKALLGSEDKKVLGSYRGESVNYHIAGIERVRKSFVSMFEYFSCRYNIKINQIESICIGCAGVDSKKDEMECNALLRSLGYKGELFIYNDAYVALVGANGGASGAVLISGTGSIAYGISKYGNHVRVGGWGHILGDEGSAYAIARDALISMVHSYDGIIPPNNIGDRIMDKLNFKSPEELIPFIYDSKTQKQHISELAPIVLELASIDKSAEHIVRKAANDLCRMVYALKNKMELESFPLGLSGSILTKSEVVRNCIIKELQSNCPEIKINCENDIPSYGALILAWKKAAE